MRNFVFLLLALLCFGGQQAMGQEITGNIQGIVTDTSGASVAEGNVTLTNQGTGVAATVKTNEKGEYFFTRVLSGVYTLRVEKAGFRTFEQKGITVSVAKISRADVTMEVGAIAETVTVVENVKQVETASMQLSASVPGQEITNLPLVGRNWINLARTLPGVTAAGADRFGLPSVSGGRTQSNNYLINGIDYNDLPLNTPQTPPSPDSIAEFRIITNTMNPEYSRNSAATLNAITKSGSNNFHGNAFWFHRDHGLNANDFFINKVGGRKPDFSQQIYGGTVGGPIYKNHTFFFGSYQGLMSGVPQILTNVNVPTTDQRNGIFTDPFPDDPNVVLPFAVTGNASSTVCPNSTCPAGTMWLDAFPADASGNVIIPTANFNSISTRILQDYPVLPAGQSVFSPVGTQTLKDDQWSLRIDQNWKKDQIYGYFFWRQANQTRPFSFTGGSIPGYGDSALSYNRQVSITYIHTFNSSMVNELRLGYNRLRFLAVTPVNNVLPSSFGFTGINPQHPDVASAPLVTITGFATWGFSNNGPQPRVDATFHYGDNLSKIWRSHNFKAGIDFRRGKIINPFNFSNNGVFSYGTSGPFSSGNSLADFLLGIPDSYAQNSGALNASKTEEYYAYAQDTWQVRPTFTIVYGVGYQVDTPYRQLDNFGVAQVAFRPGRFSTVYPTAPPGILYTGDPGIPRGTVSTRFANFGPRAGFAWSPYSDHGPLHWLTGRKGDFSIRAGIGIFYNVTEGEATLQFLGNPPLGIGSSGVSDLGGTIGSPSFADPYTTVNTTTIAGITAGSLTNKFPGPAAPPIGSQTFDFSPFLPLGISILDPDLKVPRSYNFNLTIERQAMKDLLVRVGYVGSLGRNLYNTTQANPVDTVLCASIPACRSQRPFTLLSGVPGISPFDGNIYGSLGLQQSIATSRYHSLQTSVEKRLSHGLFFRGNYTWSKSLDNSSGLEDSGNFNGMTPGDPRRDMGFSGFDATHIFTFTYDWRLPLPKPSNPFLRKVLQTWTLTGVTAIQSGFPIPIWDSSDRCLASRGTLFYDTWCRPDLIAPYKTLDPRASTTNAYLEPRLVAGLPNPNTSFAFSAPSSTTLANGLLGNVGRNPIHGPGLFNFDFAVLKDTHITETKYIQFRAEFYNMFNHAQFNNPSGNFNSSIFGQVRSTRIPARIIQMALKLYF